MKAVASLENAQRNTARLSPAAQVEAATPFLTKLWQAEAASKSLEKQVESAQRQRDWFAEWAVTSERTFSRPWPGVLQTVTTDANGAFTVRVPNDRQVVLVAKVMRTMFRGADEEYRWCITIGKKDSGPVQLSTANLLSSSP